MMSSDEMLNFVWEGIMRAINAYNNGIPLIDSETVQNTINNSDIKTALKLIEQFNLV